MKGIRFILGMSLILLTGHASQASESQNQFRYDKVPVEFQRKAIDILEENGYLNEAANILLRMNLPFRAAVLYERNQKYAKAAELYQKDGKPDKAGKIFETLAKTDLNYYLKAGDCYLESGLIDQSLTAYRNLLTTDKILKLCLTAQRHEFLGEYMATPKNASDILAQLTSSQLSNLISDLPPTPYFAQIMAMWIPYRLAPELVVPVLQQTQQHEATARVLWSQLSMPTCNQLCQMFAQNAKLLTQETYRAHSQALVKSDKQAYGDYFLKLAPFGRQMDLSLDTTEATVA
jgi:tetratricopeptide (TPR) repeat protein